MRQDIKDTLARLRYERDQFKAMSTDRRKRAAEARKKRQWLDALILMGRVHEYANCARARQEEITRLKMAYSL